MKTFFVVYDGFKRPCKVEKSTAFIKEKNKKYCKKIKMLKICFFDLGKKNIKYFRFNEIRKTVKNNMVIYKVV